MASLQGRGMASLMMLVAMSLLMCLRLSSAATYYVGDRSLWTLPSINYNLWAQSKPIRVNDVLTFTYSAEVHNVLQVSKAAYDQCSAERPIAYYPNLNGKSVVRLSRRGTYYFICGVPGHCQGGMKMAVTVP